MEYGVKGGHGECRIEGGGIAYGTGVVIGCVAEGSKLVAVGSSVGLRAEGWDARGTDGVGRLTWESGTKG